MSKKTKLTNPSPALIQYHLKLLKIKQVELASRYHVSTVAISRAINEKSGFSELKGKIVNLINKHNSTNK